MNQFTRIQDVAMQKHLELSDDIFEQQFKNCQLDPTLFSHEAHLRLAWIHIRKYGVDQAVKNIQAQLEHYVSHVGATDKYHKTLTIVAIHAVSHFMRRSNCDSFMDFIKEFPQLKTDFKQLINSHYSFNIFDSEKAKKDYIAPDIHSMN